MSDPNNENNYEQRIVAFVDILGFKELVGKTKTGGRSTDKSAEYQEKIWYALNRILEIRKDTKRHNLDAIIGVRVSTFSDNAVISCPLCNNDSFFHILIELVYLQLDLFVYGVIIRGAIVIGELYHDDDIVYGPALNEAYMLESGVANYPRIIITQDAFANGVASSIANQKYAREFDVALLKSMVRLDSDGLYYIDMLSQSQELNDPGNDYYVWLSEVRNVIVDGLSENAQNERVLVKYEWLKQYFNSVVMDGSRFFPVPDDLSYEDSMDYRRAYENLEI